MGDNPSHCSSSTLTSNSDLTDSANSGRKVKLISRKFHSRRRLVCNLSLPFVMDAHVVFRELVYAKHQFDPYPGFKSWEDPQLWDLIASRTRVEKSRILQLLKTYKDMYSADNTLRDISSSSLRNDILVMFGSRQVLGDLNVKIVEKLFQECGVIPYLPLSPYPISHNQPTCYPSGSSSDERYRVTWSTYNPEMEQLLKRAQELHRKKDNRVEVDGVSLETEEKPKILLSQLLPKYENFICELGYTGLLSKQYGEDMRSLNLIPEQMTDLLERYPPNCSQYIAIADSSPDARRKILSIFLDKTSNSVAKSSSSSVPSKRKKSM